MAKLLVKNIGTLQTPVGSFSHKGAQQGENIKLHDAAVLIEDGIITEFGQNVSGCSGIQNRATPLAAGGRSDEVAEGVVFITTTTTKFGDDAVFDHQVCILDAFNGVHLGALKLQLSLRQDSRQGSYIVDYCLHAY